MFQLYQIDFYQWSRGHTHGVHVSRKTLLSYGDLTSGLYVIACRFLGEILFGELNGHFAQMLNGHDQYRCLLTVRMPYNYAFTVPDGIWKPVIR